MYLQSAKEAACNPFASAQRAARQIGAYSGSATGIPPGLGCGQTQPWRLAIPVLFPAGERGRRGKSDEGQISQFISPAVQWYGWYGWYGWCSLPSLLVRGGKREEPAAVACWVAWLTGGSSCRSTDPRAVPHAMAHVGGSGYVQAC